MPPTTEKLKNSHWVASLVTDFRRHPETKLLVRPRTSKRVPWQDTVPQIVLT